MTKALSPLQQKLRLNSLKRVRTERSRRLAPVFAAFAETILDKMLLWGGLYPLERVRFHGIEAMNRHIAEKRGTLLICSHLGNLELCRVLSRQRS